MSQLIENSPSELHGRPRTSTDLCGLTSQVRADIAVQAAALHGRQATATDGSDQPPEQKAAGSNPAGGTTETIPDLHERESGRGLNIRTPASVCHADVTSLEFRNRGGSAMKCSLIAVMNA
jgi:hypothetical protein